jgi:hypothetical protein
MVKNNQFQSVYSNHKIVLNRNKTQTHRVQYIRFNKTYKTRRAHSYHMT